MALNYLSYTIKVHDSLMELKKLLSDYDDAGQIKEWIGYIDRLDGRLSNMRFNVAVVGEFKRGKTSFINALLRREILPADALPATATINRITYGDKPVSYIIWKDKSEPERVDIDRLSEYITQLTESSAAAASRIREAVVEYPCQFCADNVDLIDTPGMNDNDLMNDMTIGQLSDIDLAIVTLDPSSPVSATEAEFIAKLVESEQICQIIFIVSKIDMVHAPEREKLLAYVKKRLQSHVGEILRKSYDENSPVMDKFKRIMASPIIYPLSSAMALSAYSAGDSGLLEESGFTRLTDELPALIISTKHAAAVLPPLNAVARISGQFQELLRGWAEQSADADGVQTIKTQFARTAYNVSFDVSAIWGDCAGMLRAARGKRVNEVRSELYSYALQYRNKPPVIWNMVQELYSRLTAQLSEERLSIIRLVWDKHIKPKYDAMCRELGGIIGARTELMSKMGESFGALTSFDSVAPLLGEEPAFGWSSSPVPPPYMTQGRVLYIVDTAVRGSFTEYYTRRESEAAEFITAELKKLQEMTVSTVMKFFAAADSQITAKPCAHVDRELLSALSGRLSEFIRHCQTVRDNYINETNK